MTTRPEARLARLATAYDSAAVEGDETITFTMPDDISLLTDEELSALRDEGVSAFDALYESDNDLDAEDVAAMQALADAVDAIRAEEARRDEERAEARAAAEELAQRVRPAAEESVEDASEAETLAIEDEDDDNDDNDETTDVVKEPEAVTASTTPVSVTLKGVSRRRTTPAPTIEDDAPRAVITASADLPGYANGQQMSVSDIAKAFINRSRGMQADAFKSAYQRGARLRQQFGLVTIQKPFAEDLRVTGDDATDAMNAAVDEKRLPGGSLVASGGWCAPSETLYDLFELETAEGQYSLPEIEVNRGGIRWTPGPDFSAIFTGGGFFNYTEDEDIAGDYDGYGGGTKPCVKVPCPEFEEARLDLAGLCITAGILQNRAYPETIERYVRGALIGHQNLMSQRLLGAVEAGSTVVNMPAAPAGALAPVLTAMEVQIEDYRQRHRMSRDRTVEVILPYWIKGAIRSDLALRQGVEMTNVSNEVIAAHFALRGAAVQYVYNFDDLDGSVANRTGWPGSVKMLMYAAGTWIKGGADVITLDAVYDSALFKVNDFTALFTEEGWLVAKRGHDSRVVNVPICPNGATNWGASVDCDGQVESIVV